MKEIIEIKDLHRTFRVGSEDVHALDGISFSIMEGEFVSIMGTSGSGKSTLLNILGCLDKPTSGDYIINGTSINSLNKNQLSTLRNRQIGFVFQNYNLLARTTALDNVQLPLMYNHEVSAKERKERALVALEAVKLTDRMNHMPNQLSGGQQQRVSIGRALINNPALLLADEPTGNLDSENSREILRLLRKFNQEQNQTVMIITHDERIAAAADRVIAIEDGRITRDEKSPATGW